MLTRLIVELKEHGLNPTHEQYFDTLKVRPKNMTDFRVRCENNNINVRHFNDGFVGISLDETILPEDIRDILHLFEIEHPIVSLHFALHPSIPLFIG